MKLLIATLTMIFFSFGANAISINNLSEQCSKYRSNGFSIDSMNEKQIHDTMLCLSIITSYKATGVNNCEHFKMVEDVAKNKKGEANIAGIVNYLSKIMGNHDVSSTEAIRSFMIFADENPQLGNKMAYHYREEFLGKPFPCR